MGFLGMYLNTEHRVKVGVLKLRISPENLRYLNELSYITLIKKNGIQKKIHTDFIDTLPNSKLKHDKGTFLHLYQCPPLPRMKLFVPSK